MLNIHLSRGNICARLYHPANVLAASCLVLRASCLGLAKGKSLLWTQLAANYSLY